MKNPFKKSKTNTKSRVVVGGKKKTPRSKWKIAYLSLVGLLLFTTIGYGGYGIVKARSLKAKAGSWTYLYGYSGVKLYACKTFYNVYGGVYQINALWIKSASKPNYSYRINTYNGGTSNLTSSQVGNSYWLNSFASLGASIAAGRGDYASLGVDGLFNVVVRTGNPFTSASSLTYANWLADC